MSETRLAFIYRILKDDESSPSWRHPKIVHRFLKSWARDESRTSVLAVKVREEYAEDCLRDKLEGMIK